MMLGLDSDTYDRAHMYDIADSVLAQKIAQIEGVGEVHVCGSSRPAVRVQVNPTITQQSRPRHQRCRHHAAQCQCASGQRLGRERREVAGRSTPPISYSRRKEYAPLIVAYRNGAPMRLEDLGNVIDSVEDTRNDGLDNGKPTVILAISRQPAANIIDTVDHIRAVLPAIAGLACRLPST